MWKPKHREAFSAEATNEPSVFVGDSEHTMCGEDSRRLPEGRLTGREP
ncbi:MAG: hypothetical protein ACOCW2_02600 [Chitinivibrionales bacterium]